VQIVAGSQSGLTPDADIRVDRGDLRTLGNFRFLLHHVCESDHVVNVAFHLQLAPPRKIRWRRALLPSGFAPPGEPLLGTSLREISMLSIRSPWCNPRFFGNDAKDGSRVRALNLVGADAVDRVFRHGGAVARRFATR